MITTNPIRDAVIAKAQSADDATLILMLEADISNSGPDLNDEELQGILSARKRRIDGETGFSLKEIIAQKFCGIPNITASIKTNRS